MKRMEIDKGFQIEEPPVFVPWKVREDDLKELFPGHSVCEVTNGYFTTSCVSMGGLAHELGFHFHPRGGGVLIELEFFRRAYPDQAASYSEFQKHLESTFGEPTSTSPGTEGFPSCTWKLNGAEVLHFVFDRFGPEEHVRIKKR